MAGTAHTFNSKAFLLTGTPHNTADLTHTTTIINFHFQLLQTNLTDIKKKSLGVNVTADCKKNKTKKNKNMNPSSMFLVGG